MTQAPTPGPLSALETVSPQGLRTRADMVREALNDGGSCARHLEMAAAEIERLASTAPVEASGSERGRIAKVLRERVQIGGTDWDKSAYGADMNAEEVADAILALHPQPSGETREAVARVEALIEDLNYAAMPTKPDVVTLCGSTASQARDDLRAILALLSARPLALGGQQGEAKAIADLEIALSAFHKEVEVSLSGIPLARYSALQRAIFDVSAIWSAKPLTTPARAEAQDEGAALSDEDHAVIRRCVERQPKLYVRGQHEGYYIHSDIASLLDMIGRAHPSPTPAADADRVRIDHLSVAEQIMATLQEEVSALDAYDEDEISSLEANVAGIILAALKSTAAKEGGEA